MHTIPLFMLLSAIIYCLSEAISSYEVEGFGWMTLAILLASYLFAMLFDKGE